MPWTGLWQKASEIWSQDKLASFLGKEEQLEEDSQGCETKDIMKEREGRLKFSRDQVAGSLRGRTVQIQGVGRGMDKSVGYFATRVRVIEM